MVITDAEKDSSRFGLGDEALRHHRFPRDEVDADPVKLFQTQRLDREPTRIVRLPLPATAVAFQMLARRAGAEGRLSSLLRHLIEHALQGIGKVALDAGG